MPLNGASILIVSADAQTATALVEAISAARGDAVYAANSVEARQRLQQIDVAAAVLAWHARTDATVATVRAKAVPFCVFTPPPTPTMPLPDVPVASTIDQVVPTLRALGAG